MSYQVIRELRTSRARSPLRKESSSEVCQLQKSRAERRANCEREGSTGALSKAGSGFGVIAGSEDTQAGTLILTGPNAEIILSYAAGILPCSRASRSLTRVAVAEDVYSKVTNFVRK